jgi:hypothetical protein
MASENIDAAGGISEFNTRIPGLGDNANIQEALRIYHYGLSLGTDSIPSDTGLIPGSIAGHFKAVSNRVLSLESKGLGSTYASSEPTSQIVAAPPPSVPNTIPTGYIWVDANSAAPTFNTTGTQALSVARYQDEAPAGNIPDGSLWVDKNSSPLTMYVYDGTLNLWREIGSEES